MAEWHENWNITLFAFVIITLFGLLYLFLAGVSSAVFYLFLLILSFISLFSLFFFFKEGEWKKFIKIPIEKNTFQANYNFLIGAVALIAINIIRPKILPQSVLFSAKFFEILPQGSFAVFFTKVFISSVLEDLFFGFLAVLLGAVVVWFILKSMNVTLSKSMSYYVPLIGGLIVSAVFFTIFHQFNPTYTTTADFITALVFRSGINVIIWATASLMFGIGSHFGNNLLAIGFTQFGYAVMTVGGLLIALIFVIMIYSVIIGFRKGHINPLLVSS